MKLVILDRDGVINYDSDDYIKSPEEWVPIEGSLDAISRLCHADYHIIVVSNQSGLGKNIFTIDDLNRIHTRMLREISNQGGVIDAIFFCPHAPDEDCYCRKPKPGLFDQITYRTGLPLEGVPYIGDKLSDVQVALQIGARPVLVKTGYGQDCLDKNQLPDGIPVCENLVDAVDMLLA